MPSKKTSRFDTSALFLLLSNLFAIGVALWERWDLSQMMWIFWGQNIVIGFFNWRRILCLKQFSTEGYKINGRAVAPTKQTQRQTATFFAIHYGFFHLIYCVFLVAFFHSDITRSAILGMVLCTVVFALNHAFSFRHNLQRDLAAKPNIASIMFFPYARVIPMHFTLLLGFWLRQHNAGGLLLFLGLKTVADLIMHLMHHRAGPVNVNISGDNLS